VLFLSSSAVSGTALFVAPGQFAPHATKWLVCIEQFSLSHERRRQSVHCSSVQFGTDTARASKNPNGRIAGYDCGESIELRLCHSGKALLLLHQTLREFEADQAMPCFAFLDNEKGTS
jgi:hypothetical protein